MGCGPENYSWSSRHYKCSLHCTPKIWGYVPLINGITGFWTNFGLWRFLDYGVSKCRPATARPVIPLLESGVEFLLDMVCRRKARRSHVSRGRGRALGDDSLRRTDASNTYIRVCTGNHSTNQSAFVPLIGCLSFQLRAERVGSVPWNETPSSKAQDSFSVLNCQLVWLCLASLKVQKCSLNEFTSQLRQS